MRRKSMIFLVCAALCVSMLSGCGGSDADNSSAAETQAGGSFFSGTTAADASAVSTAAAESQAPAQGRIGLSWTIEDMTMELVDVSEDMDQIGQAFMNLASADGKYVMAVFKIMDGRILQTRMKELIDMDIITYNGLSPVSWTGTGLENEAGESEFDLSQDIYIAGNITCLFDVSPDLDIGSVDVVVNADLAGGGAAETAEAESSMDIDMSESLDGKTYRWGDCVFILTEKRDCNAEENESFNQFMIPNGKWGKVTFKVVSGSIDADTLDVKLKENLTLGDSYIAVITQRTSQSDIINSFGGVFVVPNDFDMEHASLTVVEY